MLFRSFLSYLGLFPFLAVAFSTSAFASKDAAPDWVRAAIAQPYSAYPPETSAVVLLDETTLSVAADGRATEHRRHVVKILRPNGREAGIVFVPFDADSKILSMHVWSVGPDGHEYAVKGSDLIEVGYPGQGNFYEDMRAEVANPPGRDPGGVVAYEYEQRQPPYVHEATWFFQSEIPHLGQTFTLVLPPGCLYHASWAHHVEKIAVDLEDHHLRWELPPIAGIDLDEVPMHPSLGSLAGRMTVHYGLPGRTTAALGTWQAVGELYDQISRDRMVASPEVAAMAAQLTAGKGDFYEKTEAVAEFVQKQIRYFVIEKGIGGLQPHFAAETFTHRYGDCKDKATLLSAMLSSVGVHAAIVLVDSHRGFIDPDAPSMLGNHAISAIEIPRGYESPRLRSLVTAKSGRRYLIVDPTWERTPYGQIENTLQGGFGVLVEGKESEIVELPTLDPSLNSVHRGGSFHLQGDGSLKGTIVEKRFGDLSERGRSLYTLQDAKDQTAALDRKLSRDFASFSVTDFKVENANALNRDLITSYSLAAERYGRSMGPLMMLRPRVFGSEAWELDRKPRQVPFDLQQTMLAQDDFTIEVPIGFAMDELPAPVNLDVGFAAYESSSQWTGNTLHYTRTLTVRQISLPAERSSDMERLTSTIYADEQNHAVFKKN